MRFRALSAALVVVLTACGSSSGDRPAISATLPADVSVVRPTNPPATDAGVPPTEAPPLETDAEVPPPETEAPQPPPEQTTAETTPSDEADDDTVWWPWVLGAIVLIGAVAALAGRGRRGPTWQARTTQLLDEIEQLTRHLVALTPEGLTAVAATDAMALATMRATLVDLITSAPDTGSGTVLNGLSRPIAELHAAVDAVSLSAGPSIQPFGATVAQLAAQLHTASTVVRADLAAGS